MSSKVSKFQKDCKRYFSSLSARGCTYLYYNLPTLENELILSNADPDHLGTYSLLYLVAIHHLKFEDDFMLNFRKYFFGDKDLECSYILKTSLLTKAFKDNRIEDIVAHIDPDTLELSFSTIDGNMLTDTSTEEIEEIVPDKNDIRQVDLDDIAGQVTLLAEPKKPLFYDKSIAGLPLHSPYVINNIIGIVTTIDERYTSICNNEYPLTVKDHVEVLTNAKKISNNWYLLPGYQYGYFYEFKDETTLNKIQNLLLIDGLDIPSIKEFLIKCKFKNEHEKFNYYVYLLDDKTSVCQLAVYESEDIHIRSTRLNNVLPIFDFSNKTKYRHTTQEVYYD